MLARQDDFSPRLKIDVHSATVRTIPLLDGRWFYSGACKCGTKTHGLAVAHSHAEAIAVDSLSCSEKTHRVLYQEVRNPSQVARLVQAHIQSPIVVQPYGRVSLSRKWKPGTVAVDASHRPHTGTIGIAAVTGRGWVQLRRLTKEYRYGTREAEFLALATGISMMPPGNRGTIYSDNKGVVDDVNKMIDGGFKGDTLPGWLSVEVHQRLHSLLADRNMSVAWRRRNSTELLQLADHFSRRCSAERFDSDAVSAELDWERGTGLLQHDECIQRVEYSYCSTVKQRLYSI